MRVSQNLKKKIPVHDGEIALVPKDDWVSALHQILCADASAISICPSTCLLC